MLDLETLNSTVDAAVVSIGAVKFNKNEITSKFYQLVDIESSLKYGTTSGATLKWWFSQPSEVIKEAVDPTAVNLRLTLERFVGFCIKNFNSADNFKYIWGNGAAFDNVILRNAYNKLELQPPWTFRQDMCYRTVKNLYPEVKLDRSGVHHNALDDAISQANHLIEINKIINIL